MNYTDIMNTNFDKPVYMLSGDAFICDEVKKQIINRLGIKQLSISFFDDENFDIDTLINYANQFSFFDEKRIVIIRNVTRELTKVEQSKLLKYLENYNKNTIILIIDTNFSKNFDFLKQKEIIDCKSSVYSASEYVWGEFAKNGKKIDRIAVKKLCDYCLLDMVRINNEIAKLCAYAGNKSEITDAMIDLLVPADIDVKVFELSESLGKKDSDRACKLLAHMLETGEQPTALLGLISSNFRRIFFAKINSGYSNAELAGYLGCKEYAVVKAKEQAKNFGARALKTIVNLLLEADYNIKSGNMTAVNALYYLIFAITSI